MAYLDLILEFIDVTCIAHIYATGLVNFGLSDPGNWAALY